MRQCVFSHAIGYLISLNRSGVFLFSMALRKKLSASNAVEMLIQNHIIKNRTFTTKLFQVGVKN